MKLIILSITLFALTSCGLSPVWVDSPECEISSKKKAINIEGSSYSGEDEYTDVFWFELEF